MPKIDWKSAAIGAALLYGYMYWRAKKATTTTAAA